MANESYDRRLRGEDNYTRSQTPASPKDNKIDAQLRRVDGLAGSEPKRLAADAKQLGRK
jgi:hypothetical protein